MYTKLGNNLLKLKDICYWIIFGLIIFLAVFIRCRINFGSKLFPGVNALYYPIQVRSLIENGHLAYDDLPVVFWLEALVAQILSLFNRESFSDCIILASKLVDSVFPVLSAIPVLLLIREWQNKDSKKKLDSLIPIAFSVIYWSPLAMTSDLQKNAISIVWVYFFIYFLYKCLQNSKWKYFLLASGFLILIGLTHIGSFGLALLFLFIIAIATLSSGKIGRKNILISFIFLLLVLIGILGFIYLFIDSVRVKRLFSAIFEFKLFENNLVSLIINKYPIPIALHDIINMIVINMIAIYSLVFLVQKKDSLLKSKRLIFVGLIVISFALSSPIIGQEWFNRLLQMAYVPASLILSFLVIESNDIVIKRFISGFVTVLILISIIMGFTVKRQPSISEESYLELNQIKKIIDKPDSTLIVARHGLEWWVAWVLRTKVAQDKAINPDTWLHYDTILFLEQLAGSFGYGPSGPFGPPFREVKIPPDAEIVYTGKHFRLARVLSPPEPPLMPQDW